MRNRRNRRNIMCLLFVILSLSLVGCTKNISPQDLSNFAKTLGSHPRPVKAVAFSSEGKTVYSTDGSHRVSAWDVNSALPVFGGGWARGQVLSLNSSIAVVGNFNFLRVIDVVNQRVLSNFEVGLNTSTAYPNYAYLSADATKVLLVDIGGNVSLWSLLERRVIHPFLATSSGTANYGRDASAFSPTNSMFSIASSKRSNLEIRDIKSGDIIQSLSVHERGVRASSFSSEGSEIATVGMNNGFRLWDVKSGELLETYDTSRISIINHIVFSPDGKLIITGHNDGSMVIWSVETGKVLKHFNAHDGWVETIAVSPNGRSLVSGGSDRKVKFWNLANILTE